MSKEKSKFRIYLEYLPFYLLYKLLHIMPLKLAMRLGMFGTKLLYYLDRTHASRAVRNILHSGFTSDHSEAIRIAKAMFREFGKLLVEIVKADQYLNDESASVSGPEATLQHILPENNTGSRQVILITAHLGNWEMAGVAYARKTATPMTSLMRDFSNPLIGKLILNHRQGKEHFLVDKKRGIRPILKALNQGHTVTVLIDQYAACGEGVECSFFGHPAKVHMTPALLHLKTGVPIMPEITYRVNDNFKFCLEVGDLIYYEPTGDKEKDIRIITQKCITALEELIRRHPEQWLWASRHWCDLDRRSAKNYLNWKPSEECAEILGSTAPCHK